MTVRAKVCGIHSEDDLRVALDAGVDALGFICGTTHRADDELQVETARRLVTAVPPYCATVLVTHLGAPQEILDLAAEIGVDTIQLHGAVEPEAEQEVFAKSRRRWRVTRAVHITGPEAFAIAQGVAHVADALHLDSRTPDRLGGTGQTHDWDVSRRIRDWAFERGIPTILSGGLRPANLEAAITAVQPYAVDVNSGVEASSGDKDPDAAERFVSLAHGQ